MVPFLGYVGYVVLILGEVYRQRKYGHHIVVQVDSIYGPMFPAIKTRKWFNPQILFSWIALGVGLFACYWFRQQITSYLNFDFFDFIMGIYLTVVLLGTVSPLWPLLTYRYAAAEQSALSGQATLSSPLIMHQLAYQMLAFSLLLAGITAYQPTSFLVGSVLVSLTVTLKCLKNARTEKENKRTVV